MIGLQHQVTGREQYLLNLWILPHLFPCRLHDEPIMVTRFRWPVWHLFAFKTDPIDTHFLHVLTRQIARLLRVERRNLSDLVALILPLEHLEFCSRVVWPFRIFHHLPKAFQAGVLLSA